MGGEIGLGQVAQGTDRTQEKIKNKKKKKKIIAAGANLSLSFSQCNLQEMIASRSLFKRDPANH